MEHEQFGHLTNVKKLEAVEKPIGEWNTGEVTLVGRQVTVRMNGKLVNQASGCELSPGKILLTAEGQEIQFRNVRLSAPTGEVVTYAAPAGEALSTDYEVWANDQKVDVYTARTLDAPFAGKEWHYRRAVCVCQLRYGGTRHGARSGRRGLCVTRSSGRLRRTSKPGSRTTTP